jgi:hypothetical protein
MLGAFVLGVTVHTMTLYIPFLKEALGLTTLQLTDWAIVGGVALVKISSIEFFKIFFHKRFLSS